MVGRVDGILPGWVLKLDVFGYMPQLPVDEVNFLTLGVITGLAVILGAAGAVAYRARDLRN
jgi:ABC-2 type transport system permease protein